MKKILILFCLFFSTSTSFARKDSLITASDSILYDIYEEVNSIKLLNENIGRYKIYPTDNIYILLKLDTGTGRIKMIQWNLDKSKEFEAYLNNDDLSGGALQHTGRFELYPTKNMYQFILIDTLLGGTWHVQWGTKLSDLWIRKISF